MIESLRDATGNLPRLTHPDGTAFTYVPDALDRLGAILDGPGRVEQVVEDGERGAAGAEVADLVDPTRVVVVDLHSGSRARQGAEDLLRQQAQRVVDEVDEGGGASSVEDRVEPVQRVR